MISNSHPSHELIPTPAELHELLNLESTSTHFGLFDSSLFGPLNEFLSASGKKFRSEIIEIGYLHAGGDLSSSQSKKINAASMMIEAIHAGSMIIDDIQDQSEIRRGQPTLHRKHGLALAINAGNWLYFRALAGISDLELEPEAELELRKYFNQIFLRAHFGQAVDVGTPMTLLPQSQAKSVCLTSMELKTGALMSLAFDLGAFLAGKTAPWKTPGSRFAKQFGIALQMMDDIGNFYGPPPKGKEDIRNGRPSFIWSVAAEIAHEKDYAHFVHAAKMLPDESFINSWAELFNLKSESKTRASQFLWNLLENCLFSNELQDRLEDLFIKLENSYV